MKHISQLGVAALFVIMICAPVSRSQDQQGQNAGGIQMTDARLGKSIQDRMIADEETSFPVGSKAYLWLNVTGGSGDSITVTWKHGEKTYPTQLFIGGSPWRTWASKTVATIGEWSVSVSDQTGAVLKEMTFTVE